MEFPLEGAWTRRAVLIVSLALAALISYQAGNIWRANNLLLSGNLRLTERGAALIPGSAEAWDRLGRLRQEDFGDYDPRHAIADFEKALQDNPHCPYCWTDMAGAYAAAGDAARARDAFHRAIIAYPISPDVAWTYGNFLLDQQEYSEAFSQIRRAVRTKPALLPLAILQTWRATHNVNQLLDQVLPPDAGAYFQAVDFFESNQQTDAGLLVWKRLLALRKPFALPRTFPLMEGLIREDRSEDVRRVWSGALAATGASSEDPANHSLISNGNFKHDLLDGGLDWRWSPNLNAAMDFDSAPDSHGGRSLRLDFEGGANTDLNEPFEYVPVESAHTYRFSAKMRTEEISTESGMRFAISDPNHPNEVSVLTDNFTGSHDWTAIDAQVTTGADTHFLRIGLVRAPSRLFDNKLSGTVWIADVSLVPSKADGEQPAR